MSSMLLSQDIMIEPYYEIYINGSKLSDSYKRYIEQIQVEESDFEADQGRISILDVDWKFSDSNLLKEGNSVKIIMGFKKKNRVMLEGKISYIEANYDDRGFPHIVVGCLETSIHLTTQKYTRTWKKKKVSDVVKEISKFYGFKLICDDTKEVKDQITQENETNGEFLKKLAEEYLFYTFLDDFKTLYFVKSLDKMPTHGILYYGIKDCNIISFAPTFTEKEKELTVRDIDNKGKKVEKKVTTSPTSHTSDAVHRDNVSSSTSYYGISGISGQSKIITK